MLDDQQVFLAGFRFDLQRDFRARGAAHRVVPEPPAPDCDWLQDIPGLAQEGRRFTGRRGRGAGGRPSACRWRGSLRKSASSSHLTCGATNVSPENSSSQTVKNVRQKKM